MSDWIAKFYEVGDPDVPPNPGFFKITSPGKGGGAAELSSSHNNRFSSAFVKPGFRARCFTNFNFTGDELRLDRDPQPGRADAILLGDGIMKFTFFPEAFNDKISSVFVEPHPPEDS